MGTARRNRRHGTDGNSHSRDESMRCLHGTIMRLSHAAIASYDCIPSTLDGTASTFVGSFNWILAFGLGPHCSGSVSRLGWGHK